MLSRIAESLFWIGRYVERAEDTARILDVQTQLILEDPGVDEGVTCRNLLSIMGVELDPDDPEEATRHIDTEEVLRVLAYDVNSNASIAAALAAARESARRARETLSPPRCGRRSTRPTAPSRRATSGRCDRPWRSAGCATAPRRSTASPRPR